MASVPQKSFELHPLCTLFPRLSGFEFDSLKLDIQNNGQREPIIIHDGMILDGGNRYRACMDLGIEPAIMQFGGDNIVTYILSANLHRRHLTPMQQAAIVASVQDWTKAHAPGKPKANSATLHLSSVEKRAAQSGASIRTQKKADKIAKASPELSAQVGRGEITARDALAKIAPKKTTPEPTDEPHYDPEAEALQNAHDTVIALSEENQALRDAIAIGNLPDAERGAGEIIVELRAKVKTLEATLSAVESTRDTLLNENAALKKQCLAQARKLKKYEGGGNV